MAGRLARYGELKRVAQRQHGYFTAAQALEAGYTHKLQSYHCNNHNWLYIERGLFRLPGHHDSFLSNCQRWFLWSRNKKSLPQAIICHQSALHWYKISDEAPHAVHLCVPPDFRREPPPDCILYKTELSGFDIQREGMLRFTSPLRTLTDTREWLTQTDAFPKAVRQAIRLGLITEPQARLRGWINLKENPILQERNMRTKFSYCGRQAFTLVELLVVVAIISILAALLMTSLKGAMEAARSVACVNNEKQISLACQNYLPDWNNYFPDCYADTRGFSWDAGFCSYLGLPDVFGLHPRYWESQKGVTYSQLGMFFCPAETRNRTHYGWIVYLGTRSYAINSNADSPTLVGRYSRIKRTSRFPLFTEWNPGSDFVGNCYNGQCDNRNLSYRAWRHGNRMNVAFADFHVATQTETLTVSEGVWEYNRFTNQE
jgi:prepilin-type N-terminal cleavage/methylation domain-containing protein/prepilin-type processing-associated H-X9-DG protein